MKKGQTQVLKERRLRRTSSRSAILGLFLRSARALSYGDLEKNLSATYDRVTVYRTLKTFLDKGVIHKVLDDAGTLKYALCNEDCTLAVHHHDHVHFKCIKCGQTSCLEGVAIPLIQLPEGFVPGEMSLLIQGECNRCHRLQ
jgi:Fur family ferric uptake transcriptional regulator